MSENQLANKEAISPDIIHSLVLDGDLSKMSQAQKVEYYNRFCQSLGLNPLTQPFQIMKFQGKEKLYAMKDCTEQLRKIYGVSVTEITSQELRGVFVVTAKAIDKNGKVDAATGAVSIDGLRGEALANALMKAETKAKRRVTLSICGLGMLDETEAETIQGVQTYKATETAPIDLSNQTTEGPVHTESKSPQPQSDKPKPTKWLNKWADKKQKDFTKEYVNTVRKLTSGEITLKIVYDNYLVNKELRAELEGIKAAKIVNDTDEAVHNEHQQEDSEQLPF